MDAIPIYPWISYRKIVHTLSHCTQSTSTPLRPNQRGCPTRPPNEWRALVKAHVNFSTSSALYILITSRYKNVLTNYTYGRSIEVWPPSSVSLVLEPDGTPHVPGSGSAASMWYKPPVYTYYSTVMSGRWELRAKNSHKGGTHLPSQSEMVWRLFSHGVPITLTNALL